MGSFGEMHANLVTRSDEVSIEKECNRSAIEFAVKDLLLGLGEDINREGIRKTPFRVAKAFSEGTRGYRQNVKDIIEGALFPESGLDTNKNGHGGGVGGLVIVRDIDLYSYCESCLLPFQIKCHIGYVPSSQRVVGLSKLPRVAEAFAKRLQEPQRLADEICSSLHQEIRPEGVAIILQCTHIPFPRDSNHKGWVKILVSSGLGVFENKNDEIWSDLFSLLKFRGIDKDKVGVLKCWCPSSKIEASDYSPIMVNAVSSIIKSLGEDPRRKELVETPSRFLKWLMNFQCVSNIDVEMNGYGDSFCNTNGEVKIYSEVSIPFWSQCEHHLLPFYGVVHIGYFLLERCDPVGKSLLQSIVHFYGFKLQVQERLTKQIAETVSQLVGGNVIVVVEASHTCMISRGIEKFGSNTATIAVLGSFSTDLEARTKFLESIPSATSFEGN
ncbi:GTP cyclohydrolase 1 [Lathyrus oleraceus]|uniref:GTP cyclohydrolase 1 n=2 Tax=Pisum sativum TaxID=3888 RepID=A0A9D5AXV9_PEA|nr:GTP cyclohydrolase 1-like [Pisum sativum]KAI5422679.1 GTP cyclohydrolase 1 [Pisum sativum]